MPILQQVGVTLWLPTGCEQALSASAAAKAKAEIPYFTKLSLPDGLIIANLRSWKNGAIFLFGVLSLSEIQQVQFTVFAGGHVFTLFKSFHKMLYILIPYPLGDFVNAQGVVF